MKSKNLRRISTIAAILAIVTVFSSCNRGYGCPSNFSLNEVLSTVVTTVINLFQ
ncbi:MAG: hypothetical protein KDD02_07400 [Phaeodactylibacter sp.]|nr:hypothetical protein [Phaeodactylibacter sp.]MCB9303439.1 hypothetical protein [Lewinellaceae bacterium]